MTKEIIQQYTDLVKEEKEIKQRIERLELEIEKLEYSLSEVTEVVTGGEGGDVKYSVEGYTKDQQKMRTELMVKKMLLSQRSALLTTLEFEILEKANEVEEFIASIDNSYMRRLVRFRAVDGMKWEEVAIRMGGGNTEDSVKKAFYRFVH